MRCRSNHNRINPQSTAQTQLKRDAVKAKREGRRGSKTKPQETKENAKELVQRRCEQSKNGRKKNRNMKNERMFVNCLDNKEFNTLSDITICN